jgi:outer membrane protein assembly factor BamA
MGGIGIGTPNYMYKFRLGGSGTMRGYLENRFRGQKYYAQQTELRFPIWKLFSGAAFLGFGDATDSSFTNAKMAYGGGIRIGLPPDYVSKVRIDVGFGRDSSGVYADFGQAF